MFELKRQQSGSYRPQRVATRDQPVETAVRSPGSTRLHPVCRQYTPLNMHLLKALQVWVVRQQLMEETGVKEPAFDALSAFPDASMHADATKVGDVYIHHLQGQ